MVALNLNKNQQDNITTSVQSALTSVSNRLSVDQRFSSTVNQTCTIDLRYAEIDGFIGASNKGNSTFSLMQNHTSDFSSEAKSNVKTAITSALDSVVEQSNEGISFGQVNLADTKQTIETYIDNNLESILKNAVSGFVNVDITNNQVCKVILNGAKIKGKVSITNSVVSEVAATLIVDAVIRNVQGLKSSADVESEISSFVSQTNIGLDPMKALIAAMAGAASGIVAGFIFQ